MVKIPKLFVLVFLQVFENILPWAVRSIIAFMCPFDGYKISLSLAAGRYNSAKMVLWQMASIRREGILPALFLAMILFPYISIGFMVTIFEKLNKDSIERIYTFSAYSEIPYIDTYQTLAYNMINPNNLCEESRDIIKTLQVPGTTGSLDCNKIGTGKAKKSSLIEIDMYEKFLGGVRRFRKQEQNDIPVGGVTPLFVPINTFMINGIYHGSDIPGIALGGSGDAHHFSSYYTSFHGLGSIMRVPFSQYIKIDINSTNKYEPIITEKIFDQQPYKKFKGCPYKEDACEVVEGNTMSFLTFKNLTSTMFAGTMITIADVQVWRTLLDQAEVRSGIMQPFRVFADFGVMNSSYFRIDRYQHNYTDPDLTGIMEALERSSVVLNHSIYIKYYNEKVTSGYSLFSTASLLVGLTVVYAAGVFCNFNGFTAAQSHIMDTMYASVFERKEDCMNNFQTVIERIVLPDKYLRPTYRYVGLRRTDQYKCDHGTLSIDGEYITKVARVAGVFEEIDVHGGRQIRKTVCSREIEELKLYESAAGNDIPKSSKN